MLESATFRFSDEALKDHCLSLDLEHSVISKMINDKGYDLNGSRVTIWLNKETNQVFIQVYNISTAQWELVVDAILDRDEASEYGTEGSDDEEDGDEEDECEGGTSSSFTAHVDPDAMDMGGDYVPPVASAAFPAHVPGILPYDDHAMC